MSNAVSRLPTDTEATQPTISATLECASCDVQLPKSFYSDSVNFFLGVLSSTVALFDIAHNTIVLLHETLLWE